MVLWSGQYFIRSSTINPAHHLSGDRGTAYWVIPLCRVACTLTVSRYPFLPIMKARRKPRCLLRFHKRSLQQHWCLTGFRFTTIPYFKSYIHNLSVLSTCPSNLHVYHLRQYSPSIIQCNTAQTTNSLPITCERICEIFRDLAQCRLYTGEKWEF